MAPRSSVSSRSAATAAIAIGVASVALWRASRRNTKAKPTEFPVDYGGFPLLPLPLRVICSLPDCIRLPLLVKAGNPSPPKDGVDVLGAAHEPYEITELIEGKVWRVRYTYLSDTSMGEALKTIFGMDLSNKSAIAANAPEHMRKRVEDDFEVMDAFNKKDDKEKVDAGCNSEQDMLVAKLDGINAGLLLYNPCRMHPRIVKWLEHLGRVDWIVSGSSSHTNQLPGTAEAFPGAKIVTASFADAKCRAVGMRPANFWSDVHRGTNGDVNGDGGIVTSATLKAPGTLEDANDLLASGGATLHHIQGDTFTQAILVQVHGVLFECDLMYLPCAKVKAKFESDPCPKSAGGRIFSYGGILGKGSPGEKHDCPVHRYMGMDPNCPFAARMCMDAPKSDGSGCKEMAASLRKMLKLEFDMAYSAHTHECDRKEFRELIDRTWGWLDGRSLIEA